MWQLHDSAALAGGVEMQAWGLEYSIRARSWEPGDGRRELGAGSWEPGAGSWEPVVGKRIA
jgi:hypothetical protein